MTYRSWRKLCLLIRGVAFCGLVVVGWLACQWVVPPDGNSEEVYARLQAHLQVGMTQQQAVEALLSFDPTDGRYSSGVTTDGRKFSTTHWDHPLMDDLPRPSEIEYATLTAGDDDGREIEVTLSRGGIVSDIDLSPGFWKYRWDRTYRELRDLPYRILHFKYRYVDIGSVVAILLVVLGVRRLRKFVVVNQPDIRLLAHRANLHI